MNFVKPAYAQGFDIAPVFGFGYFNSFGEALSAVVGPIFAIAATAVVFYFAIGAFKLITSAGDKNDVAGARDMITHAIIGFILLMVLFLIVQFVPQFLGMNIGVTR